MQATSWQAGLLRPAPHSLLFEVLRRCLGCEHTQSDPAYRKTASPVVTGPTPAQEVPGHRTVQPCNMRAYPLKRGCLLQLAVVTHWDRCCVHADKAKNRLSTIGRRPGSIWQQQISTCRRMPCRCQYTAIQQKSDHNFVARAEDVHIHSSPMRVQQFPMLKLQQKGTRAAKHSEEHWFGSYFIKNTSQAKHRPRTGM